MSQSASVHRLGGRPNPAASAGHAAPVESQTAVPALGKNEKPATAALRQQPFANPLQPPPAAPVVAATVASARSVGENSLATRLRAADPAEIPEAPALESQPNALAANTLNLPGATVPPQPPAPVVATTVQSP